MSRPQYEYLEVVYSSRPKTLVLAKGLEVPRPSWMVGKGGYDMVVTTDEDVARQLIAAGFRLRPFADTAIGIGWAVDV